MQLLPDEGPAEERVLQEAEVTGFTKDEVDGFLRRFPTRTVQLEAFLEAYVKIRAIDWTEKRAVGGTPKVIGLDAIAAELWQTRPPNLSPVEVE